MNIEITNAGLLRFAWELFNDSKRQAFSAPKHTRIASLIDPSGQEWTWISSRRYWAQTSTKSPEQSMYRNSITMCRNRNDRRKRVGYTDIYSMRERGWPTSKSSQS